MTRDYSVWSLIFSNLLVVAWAYFAKWPLANILWIYFGQSIIISFFWELRIILLTDIDLGSSQNESMESAMMFKTFQSTRLLFILGVIHFFIAKGFIYFGYTTTDYKLILMASAVFFISHFFGFNKTSSWIGRGRPPLELVYVPMLRIVPMFVPIYFAVKTSAKGNMLLIFMLSKSVIDAGSHIIESRFFGELTGVEKTYLDYEKQNLQQSEILEKRTCSFCSEKIPVNEKLYIINDSILCAKCNEIIKSHR